MRMPLRKRCLMITSTYLQIYVDQYQISQRQVLAVADGPAKRAVSSVSSCCKQSCKLWQTGKWCRLNVDRRKCCQPRSTVASLSHRASSCLTKQTTRCDDRSAVAKLWDRVPAKSPEIPLFFLKNSEIPRNSVQDRSKKSSRPKPAQSVQQFQ